ncbi:hypothetical protein [Paeniglutamicibacter sulfureus]|uniref:Uncharacterized protein n=1 Tax=Paeniglutamicibacter sulfureus TaxID=43666 RepID=A0ABU2BN36_9MICC|nr:hypothetical protein [Paeniglutamicibacter sulfureus]MDR7360062.1 hypothetical protein [Paeniglutamicibacter sulfureus]
MSNLNSCTDSMESSNARYALTALRATFQPIEGIATNSKPASLPQHTRVLVASIPGAQAVNLYAWVDADPNGPADYVREYAPAFEYILGGGSNV